MTEFRLSPEAEAELDGIWVHIARYPYVGRRREDDLRAGLRSLTAGDYVIIHRIANDDAVLILHVVHGSRDLSALFED